MNINKMIDDRMSEAIRDKTDKQIMSLEASTEAAGQTTQ